jgi:hypothetical protein
MDVVRWTPPGATGNALPWRVNAIVPLVEIVLGRLGRNGYGIALPRVAMTKIARDDFFAMENCAGRAR